MDRLPGVTRAIHDAVPGELVPLLWVVTILGSVKFLLVALSVAYWSLDSHRETIRQLLAVVAVGFGVTLALKHWLALPRPPAELFRYPIAPTPYGFPSGHAVAATTLYGGAVVLADGMRTPKRAVGAVALVLVVGLSRVALGIHYVGDILAGFAVGIVVVGVTAVVVRRGAVWGFVLAGACSLPTLLVAGFSHNAIVVAGASVGALLATVWVSDFPADGQTGRTERGTSLWVPGLGLVILGLTGTMGRFVDVTVIALVAYLVAGTSIIALPTLVERWFARTDTAPE